jgi:spoIIIJ-associated protein
MDHAKVKKIIEDFLKHLSVEYDSIELVDGIIEENPRFLVKSSDSGALIGSKGENLQALNFLIKKMVEAQLYREERTDEKQNREETLEKVKQKMNFYVDVNDYQERRIQEMIGKAKIMAERARSFERNVELPPMSSYERMLIHAYFAKDPTVTTESEGSGKFRRIVIKNQRPS